ncbi:hypothetical protein EMIT053CA3_60245 [Pseudomonas donghuensis]
MRTAMSAAPRTILWKSAVTCNSTEQLGCKDVKRATASIMQEENPSPALTSTRPDNAELDPGTVTVFPLKPASAAKATSTSDCPLEVNQQPSTPLSTSGSPRAASSWVSRRDTVDAASPSNWPA